MSLTKITAEACQKALSVTKGFEQILRKVKIISLKEGRCLAELKVEEEHTNPLNTLHGGCTATLVDSISSYAVLSNENGSVPSVSVDIHMTYIKGARLGSEILIDANTIKCGKTLAFLNVIIKDKATNDIIAHGTHTKYMMRPQ